MKPKSKLDILRMMENMEEGYSEDEIMEILGFFEENPSFVEKYKDFYDDIKTKVREDW